MKNKVLVMNAVDVTREPVVYVCYGLGSCIGLFLSDKQRKIAGGAHIPLPASCEGDFIGADLLIQQLLDSFKRSGSDLQGLSAKVTGGANLFSSALNLGQQNYIAVLELLMRQKILVAATDVGGQASRTVQFNSETTKIFITTSDKKSYSI